MQDLSIPDQIAQCEAYCGKRDWEAAATFIDAGVSAANDNRIEFQAMIAEACARDKPFDVVIVHSQSRFARNTPDLLHYTKKLEINPVEAEVVRRIFKLYIHGEGDKGPMGMKAIATVEYRGHSNPQGRRVAVL